MNKRLLTLLVAFLIATPALGIAPRIQNESVKGVSDVESSAGTATGNLSTSSVCVSSLTFSSGSSYTYLATGLYVYDISNPTYIPTSTTIAGLPGTCSAGQIQLNNTPTHVATGDIVTFGGQASQTINDTKIYVTAGGYDEQLSAWIAGLSFSDISGTLGVPAGGTGDATFTSNLPLIGNGTGALAQGTVSGNTTEFATVNGALASNQCVQTDASGNIETSGSACGAGAGSVTSVGLTTPAWLTVSGSPITTSGTLAVTGTSETANFFLAAPNGSAGALAPRAIVSADIPTLNQNTTGSAGSFTGSLTGDVTGHQGSTVVGGINGTTLAGLATGLLKNTTGTGVPSIATSADIIGLFSTCSGSQYLGADGACHNAGGGGTVTSVALTAPSWLTVGGSPVTTSGTISLTGTSETANYFLAAPNGSAGAMVPRLIVAADIPTLNQNTTGTAANATNGTTVSVSNNASYYLGMFASSTNSNQPFNLGTGLTFNPSTNALSTTTFIGALTGNATNITATSNSTLTSLPSLSLPTSQLSGDVSLTTQVSGILPYANGGTNQATPLPSPSPSTYAAWDGSDNLRANNHVNGFQTTATAAGTTPLTAASAAIQYFTGTTTQTITLPVVSTLSQTGHSFQITNLSTGLLTVESSGGNVIGTIASGQTVTYQAILLTGTTAASWNAVSGLGYVAQAQLYAQVKITGCSASFNYTTTSLAAPSNSPTGCTYTFTPNLPGTCSAPSALPGMNCTNVPPGNYTLRYEGNATESATTTGNAQASFQFWDGTNTALETSLVGNTDTTTNAIVVPGFQQTIQYTTPQSAPDFAIRGLTSTTSGSGTASVYGTTAIPGVISVYYYPSQSQLALNSNVNYPTFSVNTSTTSVTASNPFVYTNVVNDSNGGYNSSTGVYTIPVGHPGMWHFSSTSFSGSAACTPLIQDNGTTICQGGISTSGAAVGVSSCEFPVSASDLIRVVSAVSCTASGNSFLNSFSGYQVITSQAAPILVGSVTSTGSGQYHTESATVVCSSSSSITSESGSWLTSIGNVSNGGCALTIASGEFSATPWCTANLVTPFPSSTVNGVYIANTSSTSITVGGNYWNGSSITNFTNNTFNVSCFGPH